VDSRAGCCDGVLCGVVVVVGVDVGVGVEVGVGVGVAVVDCCVGAWLAAPCWAGAGEACRCAVGVCCVGVAVGGSSVGVEVGCRVGVWVAAFSWAGDGEPDCRAVGGCSVGSGLAGFGEAAADAPAGFAAGDGLGPAPPGIGGRSTPPTTTGTGLPRNPSCRLVGAIAFGSPGLPDA
jgi:hypothetical protein